MDPDGEYICRHSTASALDPSDHLSSFGGKDDQSPTLTEEDTDKRRSSDENLRPDGSIAKDIPLDINNGKKELGETSPHAQSPSFENPSKSGTDDSQQVKVVADANTDVAGDIPDVKGGVQGEDEMNIVRPQLIHHAESSDTEVAPTPEVMQNKNVATVAASSSGEVATGDTCEASMQLSAQDPPEEMPGGDLRPSSGTVGRLHGSAEEELCEEPDSSAPPLPSAETTRAVAVPIGLDANDAALPVADVVPIIDSSTVVTPSTNAARNTPSSSPHPLTDDLESGSRLPPSRNAVEPTVSSDRLHHQEQGQGDSGAPSTQASFASQDEQKAFAPTKFVVCAAILLIIVAVAVGVATAFRPEPESTMP